MPIEFICTLPSSPPPQTEIREIHLRLRPHFGRFERSRFAGIAHATAPLFAKRFTRRLEEQCHHACAIHAVAHGGLDFWHAFDVAQKLDVPFFLHVHDDFLYSARARGAVNDANTAIARAWSGAIARFVISDQLGQEYQRRYGAADYVVVTDGIERIGRTPAPRPRGKLRVYFMGLFHLEYEPNLRVFAQALRELGRDDLDVTMRIRCGGLRSRILREAGFIRVLPFADESEIERDLQQADLLYLPLPFDRAHASFVRFSLSTKLITYLGSGIPIFYHGPVESAVGSLLAKNGAAFICHSLEPAELTSVLHRFIDDRANADRVAANAFALARAEFSLPQIRKKFWSTIRRSLTP
jgi:glycosyltransferase involved in cell wall biosynthesis